MDKTDEVTIPIPPPHGYTIETSNLSISDELRIEQLPPSAGKCSSSLVCRASFVCVSGVVYVTKNLREGSSWLRPWGHELQDAMHVLFKLATAKYELTHFGKATAGLQKLFDLHEGSSTSTVSVCHPRYKDPLVELYCRSPTQQQEQLQHFVATNGIEFMIIHETNILLVDVRTTFVGFQFYGNDALFINGVVFLIWNRLVLHNISVTYPNPQSEIVGGCAQLSLTHVVTWDVLYDPLDNDPFLLLVCLQFKTLLHYPLVVLHCGMPVMSMQKRILIRLQWFFKAWLSSVMSSKKFAPNEMLAPFEQNSTSLNRPFLLTSQFEQRASDFMWLLRIHIWGTFLAAIKRLTQNWHEPGKSNCLIKTKHSDHLNMVLTQCDFCPVFGMSTGATWEFVSKIGRGVHARYAYPVQYNASLPGPAPSKPRWTDEELRIMAREEVFLPECTRFVNQALMARLHSKGLFVERTVSKCCGSGGGCGDWSTSANAGGGGGGREREKERERERLFALRTELSAYMRHGRYHPEILIAAVDAAESPCLRPWITLSRVSGDRLGGFNMEEFQALWRKNRSNLATKILEDEPIGVMTYPPPPPTQVGAWWANLFFSGPGLMDEEVKYYDEDPHSIGGNITTEEVRTSKMKGQSSPGPDGITVRDWDRCQTTLRHASSTFFCLQKLSQNGCLLPGRSISITSVVLRHYHKVLGARLQNGTKILPEQRAFIEKDGLAENNTLLAEVLHTSTSRGKPLYAAVLDVRKAFDTVSHAPLMEVLRAKGLPHNILQHIWQLYLVGKTTIQLPGDPLSPILLNIFMDEALRDQEASVRFGLGGEVVLRLAFADDVVLLAGSRAGLQTNLDRLSRALECFGLRLSAAKVKECKAFKQDLEGPLERISSAPLKPYQCMELLKVFLLPSLIYCLSFAKVMIGTLKACDVIVRAAVRRWLQLPHDNALGFFQAACSTGVWVLRNFMKSNYCPARELEDQPLFSRKVEWARTVATVGGVTPDTSLKVKNYWRARWSRSVDGADLETARSSRESTAWIDQRLVGSPRGITSPTCTSSATAYRRLSGHPGVGEVPRGHCQCPRTHETRVAWYNQVMKVVADWLEERGYRVLREPRYRTSEGIRVPDLVASKPEEDVTHVLDLQVVQSKGMDWSFSRKRAKYAGNKDLVDGIKEWSGAERVEVLPITISWKGLWHPKAVEGLSKLVMCRPLLCAIPMMVLFGTLMGWRRFGRATHRT
ncbi:hypothetical protein PR048_010843 [Dryococelus australis]|uniref:Reverse transcriptase domain-containing protein n=1 Tax=Dryococelus australis TaxID=614101 RepID=A0ABQ9I3W6_9NEOP|nr:hypothetical protein PR048_010843 [Dryococelus australis]